MQNKPESTTWNRFITDLEAGYGWARWGLPLQLGRYLRSLDMPDRSITVIYGDIDWGSGPTSVTEYYWIIRGMALTPKTVWGTATMFGGCPDFDLATTGPEETTITHRSGSCGL